MLDRSVRAARPAGLERRAFSAQYEIRSAPDGTGGTRYGLRGYATVYGKPYSMHDKIGEYTEEVRAGAGKKTLSERPDVILRMDHAGIAMARTKNGTLRLSEDSTGLEFDAPQLNGARSDVRNVVLSIEDGETDEASFAFRVPEGRNVWSADYSHREITEYSLHRGDVSVVSYGANPNTSLALRGVDLDLMNEDEARAVYERLQRRFGAHPSAGPSLALIKALAQAQG